MSDRSKYRKLSELFVVGTELIFDEDTVMWLQVMNPFDQQTCRDHAGSARARLIMALDREDSEEYLRLKADFQLYGAEKVRTDLVSAKKSSWLVEATQELEVDPEWRERMQAIRSADNVPAVPLTPDEERVISDLNKDYLTEIYKRQSEEQGFYQDLLDAMSEEELLDEYRAQWRERRGSSIAIIEYGVTEIMLSARVCVAKPDAEGKFTKGSHGSCDHSERVFDDREDVRSLPSDLFQLLRDTMEGLNMTIRESKNSDRQQSSSDSSLLPSKEGESEPSIPVETPLSAPGI